MDTASSRMKRVRVSIQGRRLQDVFDFEPARLVLLPRDLIIDEKFSWCGYIDIVGKLREIKDVIAFDPLLWIDEFHIHSSISHFCFT